MPLRRSASLVLSAVSLALASCAGTPVEPTFGTFQERNPTGYEVLGSQGNVLATGQDGGFPTTDERKYELDLGYRIGPDGEPVAFFLVTYRGDGWVYLADGSSALSILADGTLYRFTGIDTDYRKIRGRHVFESATYPVRASDLRSILTSQETIVRIGLRSGVLEVPLTPQNREHLRRFLAHEVEPLARVAAATR